jgi:hypothetical protein
LNAFLERKKTAIKKGALPNIAIASRNATTELPFPQQPRLNT